MPREKLTLLELLEMVTDNYEHVCVDNKGRGAPALIKSVRTRIKQERRSEERAHKRKVRFMALLAAGKYDGWSAMNDFFSPKERRAFNAWQSSLYRQAKKVQDLLVASEMPPAAVAKHTVEGRRLVDMVCEIPTLKA